MSFGFWFSLAEDDDEADDPDAELNNDPSFGKTFLVPRVKMPSYDLDIYTPELLRAREKVGAGSALSIVQVGGIPGRCSLFFELL